jgi:hypothetical protein
MGKMFHFLEDIVVYTDILAVLGFEKNFIPQLLSKVLLVQSFA